MPDYKGRLMMLSAHCKKSLATAILAVLFLVLADPGVAAEATGKVLYLPERASRVPADNDYNDVASEFCFARMVQGDNVAIFWSKEYGDDPRANPDQRRRFDVKHMLAECERFYSYYVNDLKLVQQGSSVSDKYKLLVYVFGGAGGTAFGGGVDNKVGALWTPAVRVNRPPYGVLAHEMVHSFQFMARLDNEGRGIGGAVNEMAAQYGLWQVYPEWMTFENYHLVDFMKQTHYAFLHSINMYHSPYVLEYWSNKHGVEFFGNLCRAAQPGEDAVTVYKRVTELSQEQFNDEMFDACRRFITWDMKRIEPVAKRYANQHHCTLTDVNDGWYAIPASHCPQNYGYNGIKLNVPAAGTKVVVEFKGVAGAEGYSAVRTENAGWRYGFVASLKDGRRVYSDVWSAAEGTGAFAMPQDIEHLWLVVMGAPTEHWPVPSRRRGGSRRGGGGSSPEEQWPYRIKLTGTTLDDSVMGSG